MEILRSLGIRGGIYRLIRYRMGAGRPGVQRRDSARESLQTCYRYLNQTGRSFAAVIQALDGELRQIICIFYLVMRALDTVEDDMTITLETRIHMLRSFHTFLYDPEWRFTGTNDKCGQLLEDFPTISAEFRNLASVYQEIIADTCRRSGAGLARFLEQKVKTLQEWDDYGHYSFGLVDMGYYCVCAAFEQKDALIEQDTKLLNSMGLLMQKTNTIRDYLEDQVDGREFWPRAVWSKYAMKLSDFSDPENIVPAVQCLNELITNALQHVPDVLTFLSRLRVHCFFTCCAVPHIYQKIPRTDPSAHQTQHVILSIRKMTTSSESTVLSSHSSSIYLSCAMLVAAVGYLYLCSESLVLDEIHESQSGF
uniref:Squalene synthase n=1 Tax=Leptobrachium leishanense TaxID=445787 RepID=A0A8C5MKF7_9ANUR